MIHANWTKFLAGAIAAIVAAFGFVNDVQAVLIDDFNDGDDVGWTHRDQLPPIFGPGIYECGTGRYCLQSTSIIPAQMNARLGSAWDKSKYPQFSEGFLRVLVRANAANTKVYLFMRSANRPADCYVYAADTSDGRFSMACGHDYSSVFYLDDVKFNLYEDWWIQAGAVGQQISIKVWKFGTIEPTVPQLTITDTLHTRGLFGVGAEHVYGAPSTILGSFDNVSYMQAGDFNDDGYLSVADFAGFAECLTEPGSTGPPPGCTRAQFDMADFDDDNDVDESDFKEFKGLLMKEHVRRAPLEE
jgi:hypothetical protein